MIRSLKGWKYIGTAEYRDYFSRDGEIAAFDPSSGTIEDVLMGFVKTGINIGDYELLCKGNRRAVYDRRLYRIIKEYEFRTASPLDLKITGEILLAVESLRT